MKLSLLFAILLLCAGMLSAQMNEDGILIIPKTLVAPTIDGVLDTAVWNYVGETLAITMDGADNPDNWDDWFDLFGSFRLLWDDNNLYFWLEVQDDIINTGTDWQYDGVELYFDGDWSQTEGAYDGVDDLQMRYNVGESTLDEIDTGYGTAAGWGFVKDGIDYVIEETDYGWVLETSIPIADLQLVADAEFGFDVQINDADETTRETMFRWWANDNNEWQHANLFGTAMLSTSRVVNGDYLPVPKGTAPTIDGQMGAGEWADAWVISGQRQERGEIPNLGAHVWGWEDCRNWGYVKWDDNNFYFYLKMWDDYYDYAEDENTNWEFDSVELYFDGDNSDSAPYDGLDDIQIRFNLGQDGAESIDAGYGTGASWDWVKETTSYVVTETALGWDVEAAIPLGDMQIPIGADFGFDWQLNDCDDPNESPNRTVYRWWAPSEPEWNNASMFGTAVLVAGTAVQNDPALVHSYALQQNYPNPFNPTTTISYSVAKTDRVQLVVYDMLGKQVATLINEVKPAGEYTVAFDASNLTSGVYLYTMTTDEQTFTNKMLLMK